MNKKLIAISICLLLTTNVFLIAVYEASGNTIYVDDDNTSGPWDGTLEHPYQYIQDGINSSSDGDIIFVYNGTYNETILLNKSIILMGENKSNTIIDGGGCGDCVNISADRVNISGFTMRNPIVQGNGIKVNSNNNTIIGNIILNRYQGYEIGIKLYSNNNTIIGNNISYGADGIYLDHSSNNTIIGNNISKYYYSGWCIYVKESSNNNCIKENTLAYGWFDCMTFISSNNNTVIGNAISCAGSRSGITCQNSIGDTIIGNNISLNYNYGIYLRDCNNVTIIDNIISHNWGGISFSEYCMDNTIKENTFSDNWGGNGEYSTEYCIDNLLYHNNFINNKPNNAWDSGTNIWYNSTLKQGNYWDDYHGEDSNGDGIGDTPYYISGGDNQDGYPLMMKYHGPVITNVSGTPNIVGFGFNVTISANATDKLSGVKTVTVNVTYPNHTNGNYTMSNITWNAYQYDLNNTWEIGQYNYTIWATDNSNNSNSSSGHHFNVSADATISIATLKDSYSGTQFINITDPPIPPENYTLVRRGLTWDEYYNAITGQNLLEISTGPVNYQEDNNTWTPINNTICQLSSDHPSYVYGYRNGNDRGLFGTYFKSNAQNEWPIAFTYNRSDDPTINALRSKLVGVGYVDPQSNWAYQYLQNVQSSQGQTTGNSITYPGIFTGTDVTWSYGNTGLKEEIQLSNTTKTLLQSHPPSQYGLNDASSYLVFITKLDHQNLNLYNSSGLLNGNVTISDTGVDFKDVLGQFKCTLPLGDAYELNNESMRQKLTYRIIHLNGNTYLLSGLKLSDLNTMTFPVVIDPTLTVYSASSDGYIYKSGSTYGTVQGASTGTVNSSGTYITIGQRKISFPGTYYIYRGFVFFNTSALPSNAYLDNATLSLYKKDDYSTTDFDITIQNGQPTYPHNPLQTGDYAKGHLLRQTVES